MALLVSCFDDVEYGETGSHHEEASCPSELDSRAPAPAEAKHVRGGVELWTIAYETIRVEYGWIGVVVWVVCNFPGIRYVQSAYSSEVQL
jgi:hypothetical protein